MSDLFTFHSVLTGVAAALALATERATNTPVTIEIDQGMVAKIREIQLEGPAAGAFAEISIQYCLNTALLPAPVWTTSKVFTRLTGGNRRNERWFLNRPILIESWNNATAFRVLETVGSAVGTDLSLIVEFDEIEKQ